MKALPASLAKLALSLLLADLFLGHAWSADWPQFLGPNRNGRSAETGLIDSWPGQGPPVVWEKEVGPGFAGPAVAGGKLILFHRIGNEEVVEALDAVTGKDLWKQAIRPPTATISALTKVRGQHPRSPATRSIRWELKVCCRP